MSLTIVLKHSEFYECNNFNKQCNAYKTVPLSHLAYGGIGKWVFLKL